MMSMPIKGERAELRKQPARSNQQHQKGVLYG